MTHREPSNAPRPRLEKKGIVMNSFIDHPTALCTADVQTPVSPHSHGVSALWMCSILVVGLWCAGEAFAEGAGSDGATSSGKAAAAQVADLDLRSLPSVASAKAGRAVGVAASRVREPLPSIGLLQTI